MNSETWFHSICCIFNFHGFSSLHCSCSAAAPLSQLKMYSFMGGGLFCAIVGNILLVVSTATDYWMQYRLSGNYAHQGLWRYCMSNKCYMQTDSIGKTLRRSFKPCGVVGTTSGGNGQLYFHTDFVILLCDCRSSGQTVMWLWERSWTYSFSLSLCIFEHIHLLKSVRNAVWLPNLVGLLFRFYSWIVFCIQRVRRFLIMIKGLNG